MKLSIITVSYNSQNTIEDTIKSVTEQSYSDIEYIIVDGRSTDNTLEIINKYKDKIAKIISEPDKGIYDAMNKGIKATGGDIVGILNSDDLYADNDVISKVVGNIGEKNADCCWGDLVYVDKSNTNKIIRNWKSSDYKEGIFKKGWAPPHPTFFVKKEIYDKFGLFDLSFPIAADYEMMLRLLKKYKISSKYIPEIMVKMRTGGNSRPFSMNMIKANFEFNKAWKKHGLKISSSFFLRRPLSKIKQFRYGKEV